MTKLKKGKANTYGCQIVAEMIPQRLVLIHTLHEFSPNTINRDFALWSLLFKTIGWHKKLEAII